MASFPGYTIVSGTKFRIHYNIYYNTDFWQQVDRFDSHIYKVMHRLDLKLLRFTDSSLHYSRIIIIIIIIIF